MALAKIFSTFFLILLISPVMVRAEDFGHTARGLFLMLPSSVFESTPEGLTENDKHDLLAKGKSEFWEISGESEDVMVFTALPFRDTSIGVRIFHNSENGNVEIAVGTLGEPVCTLELWRLDSSGRLVPIDTPQEPDVREFFARSHKLSDTIQHSVLMCLGPGGLEARPIFWNSFGMLPAKVANSINYIWHGNGFKKEVKSIPQP